MKMLKQIKAPFNEEQVKNLKSYQENPTVHPFTCGGAYCKRSEREDEGILIPTPEGWICPCGKYKQDWAHEFMSK